MSEAVKPIPLDVLESYLWGAAVLLRGSIDATSYKEYIFPLLFFKRISDVWDEEYAAALAESGGDEEYAADAMHVVNIPPESHWREVRSVTENVGQTLVGAFKRIETANPPQRIDNRDVGGLTGIFGSTRIWTNKDSMPDALLSRLIEHFSRQNLSLAACPADEMGTAYEYLIGQFADDAGHTAQEFYTNRTVVELMAQILKPKPHDSIYDPTCGSGGMLIKCLNYLKDQGEEWRGVKTYGQELNAITASIARMNLMLHGVEDFTIINSDTLTNPAFLKGGKIQQFDIVLANPPYSIKEWNREMFANDPYGRNIWGTPPQGRADYVFFQHIVCSMKPDTGRCAILFPHGVLNRIAGESTLRAEFVKLDVLDCVIGLGKNLFYNSPMEACIIICCSQKPEFKKGKALFINAKHLVQRINASSSLRPEHIHTIVDAYNRYENIEGLSKVASITEMQKNNNSLSINLYVKSEKEHVDRELDEAIKSWQIASASTFELLSSLKECLEETNGKN
ncbi:MAG: SAM-dependent DNA methyltransferase [Lentisphaeria bacterium]|nr:SAM-dependent DNA methyltransferase [Lentisphaeria bacterium]